MTTIRPSFILNCCTFRADLLYPDDPAKTLEMHFPAPSLVRCVRFPRSGNDILCHSNSAPLNAAIIAPPENCSKIKKAEDFSSAFFRLVPSPRYFAKSKPYCSGGSVPAQLLIAPAPVLRTTAS